ncbi:MAG: hypothetical protein IPH36_22645 [Saprospiraceae bacterium]|nr:hypothetical protein [Saprospiraceae bacterium]
MITALIIEDEAPAGNNCCACYQPKDFISVKGEAKTGHEALALIASPQTRPSFPRHPPARHECL